MALWLALRQVSSRLVGGAGNCQTHSQGRKPSYHVWTYHKCPCVIFRGFILKQGTMGGKCVHTNLSASRYCLVSLLTGKVVSGPRLA